MSVDLHPTVANGRQYPLVLLVPLTFENVGPDLTELSLSRLEGAALVKDARVIVKTAFDIGTATIEVGAVVLVPAVDLTAQGTTSTDLGVTDILLDTPVQVNSFDEVKTTVVAASDATIGEAFIEITYIVPERVNEVNA